MITTNFFLIACVEFVFLRVVIFSAITSFEHRVFVRKPTVEEIRRCVNNFGIPLNYFYNQYKWGSWQFSPPNDFETYFLKLDRLGIVFKQFLSIVAVTFIFAGSLRTILDPVYDDLVIVSGPHLTQPILVVLLILNLALFIYSLSFGRKLPFAANPTQITTDGKD